MRAELIVSTITLLEKKGYAFETFLHSNSCFDIVAKKNNQTFILKIYDNIDSLRPEQAREMIKVAELFGARPLIIGRCSKVLQLQKEVLYERHGIPTLRVETFQSLLEGNLPLVKYFKGRNIVELDSEKLKQKRNSAGLSLQQAADQIEISKEALHHFEHGASTSLETAEKLEEFYSCSLIKELTLPGIKESPALPIKSPKHSFLQKISGLGFSLGEFQHTPFYAADIEKKQILVEPATKLNLSKKAEGLKKSGSMFESSPLIVSKDLPKKSAEGVPVIHESDLEQMKKKKDLVKLMKEREEQ